MWKNERMWHPYIGMWKGNFGIKKLNDVISKFLFAINMAVTKHFIHYFEFLHVPKYSAYWTFQWDENRRKKINKKGAKS